MGKTNRMDAQTGTRILGWPSQGITPANDDIEERVSWFRQRLIDLGVIEMATSTKPPGFFLNWTTVTGIIALCVFIGGIFMFAWNVAYQQGLKDAEMKTLQERLAIAEKKAEAADTKATYAVAGTDESNGHKPTGKKEPK